MYASYRQCMQETQAVCQEIGRLAELTMPLGPLRGQYLPLFACELRDSRCESALKLPLEGRLGSAPRSMSELRLPAFGGLRGPLIAPLFGKPGRTKVA